jgi:hypothetical protein
VPQPPDAANAVVALLTPLFEHSEQAASAAVDPFVWMLLSAHPVAVWPTAQTDKTRW